MIRDWGPKQIVPKIKDQADNYVELIFAKMKIKAEVNIQDINEVLPLTKVVVKCY